MDLHTMSIGAHTFDLVPDVDLPQFQTQMMTVMNGGGGVIAIPALGSDTVSALLTAGAPVVFRTQHIDDTSPTAGHDDVPPDYPGEAYFDFL